jgi:PPOX class probable F420-dependent enzyme
MAEARVGHLATVTADHRPHVVPCCFALHLHTAYSAIDAKPKSTLMLQRLRNLSINPSASLLVDSYDENWANLWWVRADGVGHVIDDAERDLALGLLTAKYTQYRKTPPSGSVIAIHIQLWRAWP